MKRLLVLLAPMMLGFAGAREDIWNPQQATPTMGHSAIPANQLVTSTTAHITFTATVTDKDTYQRAVAPNDFAERAGLETDISVEADPALSGVASTNTSFDTSTGTLTETYTWNGPFQLVDSGDVSYVIQKFRGKDNVTLTTRHDEPTSWSDCQIEYRYVPHAGGGGEGG